MKILAVVAVCGVLTGVPFLQVTEEGNVMGRVYGPYGDAMHGARVSFVRPNRDVVAETETSHDGHFEVARVATGSYALKAKYRGCKDVDTRVTVSRTKTAFVPLLMPLTAVADDAVSISGVVLEQSGAPAADVSVCLHVPYAACDADVATTTGRAGRCDVSAPRHVPLVVVAVGDGRFGAAMSPLCL